MLSVSYQRNKHSLRLSNTLELNDRQSFSSPLVISKKSAANRELLEDTNTHSSHNSDTKLMLVFKQTVLKHIKQIEEEEQQKQQHKDKKLVYQQ